MRFEYGVIVVLGFIIFSVTGIIAYEPYQIPQFHSPYSRSQLFEMHDVVVDVSRSAQLDFPDGPAVMFVVNEFYKNPKNVSHLTVRGNFEQDSDFCENPRHDNKCSRLLVYLYEDNGVYYQGEYFSFITDECDARCHLGIKK